MKNNCGYNKLIVFLDFCSQDLFTFLNEQGINTHEHEIATHFPKQSLKALNPLLSLKQADLYPRVTVFVQD